MRGGGRGEEGLKALGGRGGPQALLDLRQIGLMMGGGGRQEGGSIGEVLRGEKGKGLGTLPCIHRAGVRKGELLSTHRSAPVDLADSDDQLGRLLQHPLLPGLLGVAGEPGPRHALQARCKEGRGGCVHVSV